MRGTFLLLVLSAVFLGLSCAPVDERKNNPEVIVKEERPAPLELPKEMKPRVEATLQQIHSRELDTTYSFWTIFHGILGMGFDTQLFDRKSGNKINAIEHIRSGKELPGQPYVLRGLKFVPTIDGVDVRLGPVPIGQGHQDQFISEMSQWGMRPDAKFVIDGKDYTFLDFARLSKARASLHRLDIVSYSGMPDARPQGQELGWAVMMIAEFFGIDTPPWTNMFGEKVTLEELLRAELKINMPKAACGGTHSLFGLTWVLHRHLQNGGKIEGVWVDIDKHIEHYKVMAKKFRHPDGSFSTQYVNGEEDVKDSDRRINTTGHTLEWLAMALSDEELREPWVQDAVMALCKMILDKAHTDIDTGSLYHATHGLHIYHDRVYGTPNLPGQTVIPLRPGWGRK